MKCRKGLSSQMCRNMLRYGSLYSGPGARTRSACRAESDKVHGAMDENAPPNSNCDGAEHEIGLFPCGWQALLRILGSPPLCCPGRESNLKKLSSLQYRQCRTWFAIACEEVLAIVCIRDIRIHRSNHRPAQMQTGRRCRRPVVDSFRAEGANLPTSSASSHGSSADERHQKFLVRVNLPCLS